MQTHSHVISSQEAGTLFGLFQHRVKLSPEKAAFRFFDKRANKWVKRTWGQTEKELALWQSALQRESLNKGDRVVMMMSSSYERTLFELSAFSLGLVSVPVFAQDTPENISSILKDVDAKFLLIEGDIQQNILQDIASELSHTTAVGLEKLRIVRLDEITHWLYNRENPRPHPVAVNPDDLATIHYTSGTSGKPKGVMLSHRQILSNFEALLATITIKSDDLAIPFTGSAAIFTMGGIETAFPTSLEDLAMLNPTLIVSATRLYQYLYSLLRQGDKPYHSDCKHILGERLRYAFFAGGKLAPKILRTFVELGVPLLNSYGQAEAGPVISVNRIEDNVPSSVGKPLPGTEVRVENGVLLVKSPSIMMGYWNNDTATAKTLGKGWLQTGDSASIDEKGRIFIQGRLNDLITLPDGNSVAPIDLEAALLEDAMFDNAMVIGKNRPYLTALIVLNDKVFDHFRTHVLGASPAAALTDLTIKQAVLKRITALISDVTDGNVAISDCTLLTEPWTFQSGLLSASHKLKRTEILKRFTKDIKQMYRSSPSLFKKNFIRN